eukprot:4799136-Lingulodinium_polyedra.AAC.1
MTSGTDTTRASVTSARQIVRKTHARIDVDLKKRAHPRGPRRLCYLPLCWLGFATLWELAG